MGFRAFIASQNMISGSRTRYIKLSQTVSASKTERRVVCSTPYPAACMTSVCMRSFPAEQTSLDQETRMTHAINAVKVL
jgi:hypothetical protein